MTASTASAAKTVVYRHACHCDTASRPPEPHDEPEHRFDVDGEPFPFHITTKGATFTRHTSGLYIVAVEVLPLDHHTNELFDVTVSSNPPFLTIGDRGFPWLLLDEVRVTIESLTVRDLWILSLRFVAESVDTDGPVEDLASKLAEQVRE